MDRNKYQIQIPLPPKIDPTVTMMTVEEKPDVTYSDIGGCKEQVLILIELLLPSAAVTLCNGKGAGAPIGSCCLQLDVGRCVRACLMQTPCTIAVWKGLPSVSCQQLH